MDTLYIQIFNTRLIYSREGRSWAKGDSKNIGVEKYIWGCHGNSKSKLSGLISPEKNMGKFSQSDFSILIGFRRRFRERVVQYILYNISGENCPDSIK